MPTFSTQQVDMEAPQISTCEMHARVETQGYSQLQLWLSAWPATQQPLGMPSQRVLLWVQTRSGVSQVRSVLQGPPSLPASTQH
jgi:hypothetical protein